jgi:hypothetical protein
VNASTVFAYDQAHQSLVFPGPEGQPVGLHVNEIAKTGHWGDAATLDAGFRAALPRFDRPTIEIPNLPPGAMAAIRRGKR